MNLRGKNGVMLTQGLFVEHGNKDAPYSFRQEDFTKNGKTYKSIYQIYMQCVDEHEAALKIVGSLAHWRKLCGLSWFMDGLHIGPIENGYDLPGVAQWREDMAARDASRAKKLLMEAAEEGNVQAQRILFDSSNKTPKAAKSKQKKQTGSVTNLQDRFKAINT